MTSATLNGGGGQRRAQTKSYRRLSAIKILEKGARASIGPVKLKLKPKGGTYVLLQMGPWEIVSKLVVARVCTGRDALFDFVLDILRNLVFKVVVVVAHARMRWACVNADVDAGAGADADVAEAAGFSDARPGRQGWRGAPVYSRGASPAARIRFKVSPLRSSTFR